MSCDFSSYGVAKKIKPELNALKNELTRTFTDTAERQQEQLDRIEGLLTALLGMLRPDELAKPALVRKPQEKQP